ncbi:flavin reductase family protein [Actinocatenispora rupis]|nr:2Fe-2S iron-sulfur cluster-binding protein [Actinocatenispora rupis]
MLHTLAVAGSTREIWWLHTTRSAAEHAFAGEAHRLLGTLRHSHEHVYYTAPDATTGTAPGVHQGRLDRDTLAALGLPSTSVVYLCGPDRFMVAMREALAALGVPDDRVHTELFGALPALTPGIADTAHPRPHPPPGETGTGPRVTFVRSGLTVPYDDRCGSILEFAETCDVPTRWSCRTGVCHTCQTPALTGSVRYRPDPLEPPPSGTVLICCSRPDTDLTLDL